MGREWVFTTSHFEERRCPFIGKSAQLTPENNRNHHRIRQVGLVPRKKSDPEFYFPDLLAGGFADLLGGVLFFAGLVAVTPVLFSRMYLIPGPAIKACMSDDSVKPAGGSNWLAAGAVNCI
jgi:hypothetical protein